MSVLQQNISGSQQQQQASDLDPISKFRLLLPRLKESLINLFRDSAQTFKINAALDTISVADGQQQERNEKFEKRIEDFCGICDQIEINLQLALELHHQSVDSIKNTPLPVTVSKQETNMPQEGQTYSQYLSTIRQQIIYAKEIHYLLHESVTRLCDRVSLPTQSQPQQHSSLQTPLTLE